MFHPSVETRKSGVWIYFFGSLGLLAHPVGISPPDITKILPVSVDITKIVPVSGIMFFATAYAYLVFTSSAVSEYSYYRVKTSKEELDAIISQPITSIVLNNSVYQSILDKILERTETDTRVIQIASLIRNLIEIGLPCVFGALCLFVLLSDGHTALVRIVSML